MELTYRGANCVVINAKKTTMVIDPKLSLVGQKDVVIKNSIQVLTDDQFLVPTDQKLCINSPGEYEVADVSIKGIAAKRHIDHDDVKRSTMYHMDLGEVRVVIIGHIASLLTDDQFEQIGTADVVIIPVGGNGYTLDAQAATSIVRRIDPKVVVPTHYADPALNYEVPQAEFDVFAKELGAPQEVVEKLKLKSGSLPAALTLVKVARA